MKEIEISKSLDSSKLGYVLNHIPEASKMVLTDTSVFIVTTFMLKDEPQNIIERLQQISRFFDASKELFEVPLVPYYVPGVYAFGLHYLLVPDKGSSIEKGFSEPINVKLEEINKILRDVSRELSESARSVLGYRLVDLSLDLKVFLKTKNIKLEEATFGESVKEKHKTEEMIEKFNQLPEGVFFQQILKITARSTEDITALVASFQRTDKA